MKKTFTLLTSSLLAFSVIPGCTEKQDKGSDAKGAGSKNDSAAKMINDGSEKMTITLMNNSNKGGGWLSPTVTCRWCNIAVPKMFYVSRF